MRLDNQGIVRRLGVACSWMPWPKAETGMVIDATRDEWRIIVTLGAAGRHDRDDRVHASISYRNRMPEYKDLVMLHHAVWGDDGYAYQVFAPKAEHVNIHSYALHLWGLLDGGAELPVFGNSIPGVRSI